ncbi:MAG: polysaccharide biosynthesis tyrosine autokinase [Oscillospiraceae bacterium]
MDMEETLDLGYLFGVLKKHLLLLILVGVLCGAAGFGVSNFLIPKKYESRALLYVENNQQASESVNINDINAAQKLVNTCQIIFKSSTMMDNLIANLDLPYTKDVLDDMITASSVNNTEIMELVVESSSAQEAEMIVNELVELSKEEFSRVIKSGSIEVIDYGEVNTDPSSPNVMLLTAAAFILGIVVTYIAVLVREMLDVAVKNSDNLAQLYDIPVFAEIVDFDNSNGSKYGYGYGKKAANATAEKNNLSERFISESTPFAITEAYNTARTNTMFAVSTGSRKIIAVTSSNPSEGKSTTCANFAISFANAGFKVLLVECDMRKPTVAKNFNIKPKNGLSSVLGGFCSVNDAINEDVTKGLDVIAAGDIPPNPSELLGSEAMKTFLSASAESYDYVFLDTPPVNVVTDSQLMNDVIAGIVFVVRENSTTHPDIQSALEKIRLANGKLLGFVKTFGRTGKSGRYGKKYSYSTYKYGYSENGSQNTSRNGEKV